MSLSLFFKQLSEIICSPSGLEAGTLFSVPITNSVVSNAIKLSLKYSYTSTSFISSIIGELTCWIFHPEACLKINMYLSAELATIQKILHSCAVEQTLRENSEESNDGIYSISVWLVVLIKETTFPFTVHEEPAACLNAATQTNILYLLILTYWTLMGSTWKISKQSQTALGDHMFWKKFPPRSNS